jgi:hypothetical protein
MSDPSKTARELSLRPHERNAVFRGLRALVVTTDRTRARILSNAVADRGGALFSVDPIAFDPVTLSEVDLEVLFLDARDGEAIERVERIACDDQRLRWAARIWMSLEELTTGDAIDEEAFESAVKQHVVAERELEEALRANQRHIVKIAPLGPSRILRTAMQTGPWCLRYFGPNVIGSIEISDIGKVDLASWDEEAESPVHWEGAPALFAFRSITAGAIEIERPETEHVHTSGVQPVAEVTVQRAPPAVLLARSRDREATVRAKVDFQAIDEPSAGQTKRADSRDTVVPGVEITKGDSPTVERTVSRSGTVSAKPSDAERGPGQSHSTEREGPSETTEQTPNPFVRRELPDEPGFIESQSTDVGRERRTSEIVPRTSEPVPLVVRKTPLPLSHRKTPLPSKQPDTPIPASQDWGKDFLGPVSAAPQMPRRFRPTAPRAPIDNAPASEPVIPLERRRG